MKIFAQRKYLRSSSTIQVNTSQLVITYFRELEHAQPRLITPTKNDRSISSFHGSTTGSKRLTKSFTLLPNLVICSLSGLWA